MSRRWFARILMGVVLALGLTVETAGALAQDKVVYHIDDAGVQATRALRSLRNHLDIDPTAKIAVVTHGDGIDFLFEGAQDKKNNLEYSGLVSDLAARGVIFQVCELTMKLRGIDTSRFMLETQFTPSGVLQITRLQTREGFAYIKP